LTKLKLLSSYKTCVFNSGNNFFTVTMAVISYVFIFDSKTAESGTYSYSLN